MRKLHVISAVVALALLLVACSGYPAARLQSKADDTIEIIEPLPSQSPVQALDAGSSPSPGSTGPPRPKQSPRVIARTKSGTTITVGPGGLPRADIWPAAEDRRGLTDSEIRLCMHAAFALGPVFNTSPDDGNVYWKKVNGEGGVYGRQVKVTYLDDLYTSAGTTQALDKCESEQDPFLYIGGVGFDQAPAGRSWAESHHQPYLFNMAVEATGLKYSFSLLPSIETNGRILGQFVGSRFPGKKVAVIYVDTDNWRAGYQTFESELNRKGMQVWKAYPIVNNNYPDFTSIIKEMQLNGVEVVDAYINALALSRFLLQSDQNGFLPLVVSPDGFDLVGDTVGNGAQGDGTDHLRNFAGVYAAWVSPAYEMGPPAAKDRTSVSWYPEMQAMKDAYARYLPSKTPNDVDWAFWLFNRILHKMLLDCSKDCSRNVLAGMMLTGYKIDIMGCSIDFSMGNGRIGGHYHNIYKTEASGSRSYWRQIETCKKGF